MGCSKLNKEEETIQNHTMFIELTSYQVFCSRDQANDQIDAKVCVLSQGEKQRSNASPMLSRLHCQLSCLPDQGERGWCV